MSTGRKIHGRHFDCPAKPRAFGRPRVDLRALYAEWKKLSPNLEVESIGDRPIEEYEDPEREVRMWWTNQQIKNRKSPIKSWNDLKPNEARYLLRCMREESGDGPAYRAELIARLARELFGAAWDRLIGDRLMARFRIGRLEELSPRQAHEFMEELISRIARRDGKEIDDVRAEFRKKGI